MSVDRFLSGIVALTAVTLTVLVARRELLRSTERPTPAIGNSFDRDWVTYSKAGRALGPQHSPIHIVYFSELQCPFCKRFELSLRRLDSLFPGKITRTFIHYPIPSHDQAYPAAIAAECAGAQGRFWELLASAFEHQTRLDSIDWPAFAARASVADTVAFRACLTSDWPKRAIARGTELGKKIGVRGTPTSFINGWRLDGSPPDSTVERIVRNLLRIGRPS
jgi:protein-disulfide isomerase